jgi:O-antigen/teichoic acid export membrane protein
MEFITEHLKQIGVGAVVVFLGSVLGQGISLLSQVFIARSLGPSIFGQIALALTIATVAAQLSAIGLPEGITRQLASSQSRSDREDIIRSGVLMLLVSSTVGASIIYLFRDNFVSQLGNSGLGLALSLFSILVLCQPLSHVPISILRSRKESTKATILRDLAPKAIAATCLIVVFSLGFRYEGAVSYWIVQPIAILILSPLFLHNFSIGSIFRIPSKDVFTDLFSFSWPLAIETGFLLMMSNFDILMLGYFLTSADVGYYRAVQPISFALGLILSSSVFIYLPTATELFSNSQFEELDQLFKSVTKWSSIATIPLASLFIFESSNLVTLLFTREYISASLPLSILSVGMLLRVVVGPNGATVKAIGETQIDLYATGTAAAANILLNILLIPRFGIQGAAMATSISFLIYNTIELVVIHRTVSIQPFSVDLIKLSISLLFIGYIISQLITFGGWLRIICYGILMTASVPITLIITNGLNTTEYEAISSIKDNIQDVIKSILF